MIEATRPGVSSRYSEFVPAFIATVAVLVLQAIGGFASLEDFGGDNDS